MLPRKVCANIFGAFRNRKSGLWANAAGMRRSFIQRSACHRRNSTSSAERCSVLTTAVVPSYSSSRSLIISPTPIASPVAGGEVLLVTVEGSAPRIVRVDPSDGSEATELDLADFLQQRWGMPVSYVITREDP